MKGCSTKFAIRGIMQSLEMEMKDRGLDGIRFTTLCPYFTRTPMILNLRMRPTSTSPHFIWWFLIPFALLINFHCFYMRKKKKKKLDDLFETTVQTISKIVIDNKLEYQKMYFPGGSGICEFQEMDSNSNSNDNDPYKEVIRGGLKLKKGKSKFKKKFERLAKKAAVSHREKVEKFNQQMSELTEFNDIPKVSWTK
ncbi:Uncharacterized protein ACO02O_04142 [Dirofilaria immitis]